MSLAIEGGNCPSYPNGTNLQCDRLACINETRSAAKFESCCGGGGKAMGLRGGQIALCVQGARPALSCCSVCTQLQ